MARLTSQCVLLLSVCVLVSGSSSLSKRRTKEIELQATPNSMHVGLTRDLCINCSFLPQADTNLNVLISLILSKDSGDHYVFKELAAITSSLQDNVIVKDSLGANVTGQLRQNQESFLSFCWTYPSAQVQGGYKCEASGVDNFGHPLTVSAMTNVTETAVDHDALLSKMQQMEVLLYSQTNQLTNTNAKLQNLLTKSSTEIAQLQLKVQDLQAESANQKSQLFSQEGQLHLVMSRLQKSRAAITKYSSSFQNHKYHLTEMLWLNTAMVDSLCALYGGYLAEIDGEDEFNFLHDFLKNNSVSGDILIGGTQKDHPLTWTYERSGQNATYFNWAPSEPGTGHCRSLNAGADFKMIDQACYNSAWKQFLCEVPI